MSDDLVPPVLPRYAGVRRSTWLVLHGWAQAADYWTPVARRLAGAGVTLRCPAMAALANACAAPAGSWERMQELVERLSAALAPMRVEAVLGHSAGCGVAVLLGHRLADLRGLCLIEPLPHLLGLRQAQPPAARMGSVDEAPADRSRLRRWYPFASAHDLDTIAASIPDASVTPTALTPGTPPDGRRGAAVHHALRTLPIPLVLVRGERSGFLDAAGAHAIAALAPTAITATVAGAGHSAHVDRPRALAQLLLAALQPATPQPTAAGWPTVWEDAAL